MIMYFSFLVARLKLHMRNVPSSSRHRSLSSFWGDSDLKAVDCRFMTSPVEAEDHFPGPRNTYLRRYCS